eukprot:4344842-Amphidinium_carterae.2
MSLALPHCVVPIHTGLPEDIWGQEDHSCGEAVFALGGVDPRQLRTWSPAVHRQADDPIANSLTHCTMQIKGPSGLMGGPFKSDAVIPISSLQQRCPLHRAAGRAPKSWQTQKKHDLLTPREHLDLFGVASCTRVFVAFLRSLRELFAGDLETQGEESLIRVEVACLATT